MVGKRNLGQLGVLLRGLLPAVAVGLVCVAVAAAVHGTAAAASRKTAAAPRPDIVMKLIPFGAKRRAETAAYAQRHYGARPGGSTIRA